MLQNDKTPLSDLFSLVRTWEVLEKYLDLELKAQESSLARFAVMNTLYRHGGDLTPSQLALEIYRSDNAISSVLNSLEKEGFVKRVRSDADGRSVNIAITDKGWEKTNRMTPRAQEFSRDILSSLENTERDTLLGILKKLRKSLLTKMGNSQANVAEKDKMGVLMS